MEAVPVGVIGCGYWGPNLIRNFNELPSADLVAVADIRPDQLKRVKSNYTNVYTTTDYKELLGDTTQAVVVATPPTTHHDIVMDCLEHGKHVLVEKPIALTSAEAREMCELARAKDRILMVGHTFAYNPAVHELRRLMESGEIGEVHYIDTARLNLGLFQNGLNVLWDLAPHDISILLFLIKDNPISVSALGTQCVFDGIHDVVYLTLRFPNNILAHAHVSWLDPCKVRRVTVVGSQKMVVYNDIESQEKIRIYDKGIDGPARGDTQWDSAHFSYRYGDIIIPNIKSAEPLRQECSHFIDCINTHTTPCSCGEEGYKVVKILEAAQKSLSNSGHMEVLEW